jgi:outer membrane receptor for ferrienterochelin and colicin
MKSGLRWFAALAVAFAATGAAVEHAHAQAVTTAAVTGQVTGTDGQPLANVQIAVLNMATGAQRGVLTRDDGRYLIPGLRPGGPYRIEAQLIGFGTEVADSVSLALGETRQIDFALQSQAVALEGIAVEANRGQNVAPGVRTVVTERQIASSPTLNREIVDLARFTPQAFVANEDDDGAAISIAGQHNEANGLFIDGLVNNDVFGLAAQGTNGGQTGAPPISFDAIEQLQIAISPFDVTQSGFTGGAINAITRSGTNEFTGSFYYQLRNENLAGETPGPIPDSARAKLADFSTGRYGFRLGGPIVQNKLFFFLNGELFRSETPRPFTPSLYRGESGGRLGEIRQVLQEELGYDPGDFGTSASTLDDNKVLGKLDWNINDQHRASLRHSYSHSDNIDAFGSSSSTINYANDSEVFPNTTNSTALELNSTFEGGVYANKLLLGMTFVSDDRNFAGDPFPAVAIEDGSGVFINMGPEAFSTGNILEQSIFSVTNNFNIFRGRHTLTVGGHFEYYDILNLFLRQNFGDYDYESVDDFLQSVCAAGNGSSAYCQQLRDEMGGTISPARPSRYQRGFSLVDDRIGDASDASAAFSAYQIGFYVQDDFQLSDRLRLTGGLRVDVPKITTDPRFAPDVFETTIPDISAVNDLEGARPGETPKAQPYFAPRLGFNYEATDNATVRGGLGVFTGRVPFVFPGAMFTNNGTTAGFIDTRNDLPGGGPVPFIPDPTNGLTAEDFGQDAIPSGELDIFAEDYKYPRVFRTSLGVDMDLPWDLVGTLEGQYTKTMDAITVRNVNFRAQNDQLDGPDNRPVYNYGIDTRFNSFNVGATNIDTRYTSIMLVSNTGEGYTYDLTASLQKELFDRNLFLRLAYTYGDSYSTNDATSDQIFSVWRFNENVRGLNDLDVARSDFSIGNRVLGLATYRQEFLNNLATTISLVYIGESGRPYSYQIGNNFGFTGEGSGTAPLVYVPNQASDLQWAPFTFGGRTYTVAEQQAAFESFVNADDHLSEQRGTYSERNASRTPFEHVVDVKLAQELFANVGGRRNTIEATLDIFNFTNLLNKDWGWRYDPGFRTVDLLRFERFRDPVNGDLTPVYTFRLLDADGNFLTTADDYWDTEILDFGTYGSRWLMQFGLRYTF